MVEVYRWYFFHLARRRKKFERFYLKFCDEYSESKKMKSKIKFECNISKESVNFLDVKVRICNKNIKTSVYSKPTDAHLYLNRRSCHPNHVIQNLPKGQFIRVRRICSDISEFDNYCKTMKKHFISRGYDEKVLSKSIQNVRKMERMDPISLRPEPLFIIWLLLRLWIMLLCYFKFCRL